VASIVLQNPRNSKAISIHSFIYIRLTMVVRTHQFSCRVVCGNYYYNIVTQRHYHLFHKLKLGLLLLLFPQRRLCFRPGLFVDLTCSLRLSVSRMCQKGVGDFREICGKYGPGTKSIDLGRSKTFTLCLTLRNKALPIAC